MNKNEINDAFIIRIEELMKYKSLNQRTLANEKCRKDLTYD